MALVASAERLAARGKGILAADESTGTIGKRLEKIGLPNTEDVRREYRELFMTAPLGEHLSGVILFKETLGQSTASGKRFVDCLVEQGIMPGIKVDEGLEPLATAHEGETSTRGLDTLADCCRGYAAVGARFAKWRAALRIDDAGNCPSEKAIEVNATQLAQYASICQAAGLVPLVEPEILIDGAHDIRRSQQVTERVLSACVAQLWRHNVALEACLLKPQMVIPGADYSGPAPSSDDVAAHTLDALRRSVPPAIPGIMFLSGGQSEEEATVHLNALNVSAARLGRCPWALSFSFGRALQASVLDIWGRDRSAVDAAKGMATALAAANAAATCGEYRGPHPSLRAAAAGGEKASLREAFRGWNGGGGGGGGGAAVFGASYNNSDAALLRGN